MELNPHVRSIRTVTLGGLPQVTKEAVDKCRFSTDCESLDRPLAMYLFSCLCVMTETFTDQTYETSLGLYHIM